MAHHAWKRAVLVPVYFFLGGIAGGCYVLGALSPDLAPRAFRVPLPLLAASAALLTWDLTRPSRFWRLFAVLKPESPLSIGAWTLLAFGPFALAAFFLPGLRSPFLLVPGTLLAVLLASYTGVLLTVSSRPLWNRSLLLGPIFFCAAAGTSAATLLLLRRGPADGALLRIAALSLLAQGILLAAHLAGTAAAVGWGHPDLARLYRGRFAPEFWGSVAIGILAPAALALTAVTPTVPAVLALAGGFLFRRAIFLAGE